MSTPEIVAPEESNRVLFFQSQTEIEAELTQTAIDIADTTTVSIADIALPHKETTFDLGIIYKSKDESQVSAEFTYHRGIDSLTLPWVRLSQSYVEDEVQHTIKDQLRSTAQGSIVRQRVVERRLPGGEVLKSPEKIKPARPTTILAMAKLATWHTQAQKL